MNAPTLDAKLNLTVDLREVIDRLKPEDRADIIKSVGFDEQFIGMVVEMLSTGSTEDGWWFGDDTLQKLRDKLTDNMRGLQIQTIKSLRNQRDEAIAKANRMDEWVWRMYHLRDDLSAARIQWPSPPPWKQGDWTSVEMAAAVLDEAES